MRSDSPSRNHAALSPGWQVTDQIGWIAASGCRMMWRGPVQVMNVSVAYFVIRRSTRSRGSVTSDPPCPRNDRTRARGRTMQRRPSLPDPARRCGTRQKTIACTGGAAMFLMEGMPRSRRIRAFVRLEGPPVRSDDRFDARRRRALDRTVANPL